ncbi:MAG: ADP-ribosylglycohydrolase family protein [Polyangiaceae bacterium]
MTVATGERIQGAVFGAAVGDALGFPVEFVKSLDEIRAKHGPAGVTGYVRYWERGDRRFAPYSDDTQMAELVLRTLVWQRKRGADLDTTMRHLATYFVLWCYKPVGGHRAPGNSCMAGCRALYSGVPWNEAGAEDAGGCGSVMRVYPVALAFAADPEKAEQWALAQSSLTHRAPIAFAACAAMTRGLIEVLKGADVGQVLETMQAAATRHDAGTGAMIRDAVRSAGDSEAPECVLERLKGWAAHEAIAAAAFVFARHPDSPREALLEAVNSPGDSDSIGTLVGALSGARCGLAALPEPWRLDLERSAELGALAAEAASLFAP